MNKTELILKLSKMTLDEIADYILSLQIVKENNITDKSNETEPKELKFFGNYIELKEMIESKYNIRCYEYIPDNRMFYQLKLMEGNVNFYDNGTVLIQGKDKIKEKIKQKLYIILKDYDKLHNNSEK